MLARLEVKRVAEPAAVRAPNGLIVFDVFNPSVAVLLSDRSREVVDTPEFTLPDGRTFSRGTCPQS